MGANPGLALWVEQQAMALSDPATRAALARWNDARRSADLPDEFNPALVDLDKFDALVAALGPAPAGLDGKPVALNPRQLRIGTSAPTTPGSFKAPLHLRVVSTQTSFVTVQADAATDCALAGTRAAAARTLTRQAQRDVAAAEAIKDSGTAARLRRWAVARVWQENAEAAAACAPGDSALAADAADAKKAASEAVMLGGSMG